MTTPVFEGMPILDRSEILTPTGQEERIKVWDLEPPELHTLHVFQRLLLSAREIRSA